MAGLQQQQRYQQHSSLAVDKQLEVLRCHQDGGILLASSGLTGRYWLGSLRFFQTPEVTSGLDKCTASVCLEAGVCDAHWLDSTHVTVGLDSGEISIWDLQDNYRSFVMLQTAGAHDDVITSMSVVCDRKGLATSSLDRSIKIWDASNLLVLFSSQAHSDAVTSIDCHPSEPDVFVSCGQDDKILVWDRRKNKPASILSKSPLVYAPTCAKWQPSHTYKMAVGSESGQVVMLDIRMGVDNYLTSTAHSRSVHSLQFCPSRTSLLASVSEDCTTSVTAIDEDGLSQVYKDSSHQDFVQGLAWSSESQLLTCGWDGRILCHSWQQKTATALELAAPADVTVKGNTGRHSPHFEAGDHVDSNSKETNKLSYSQIVKAQHTVTPQHETK